MSRTSFQPSRRALIGGALAGLGGLALPRRARASAVSGADRKFVFIFAGGGWDPSMTMDEDLDNPALELESGTERGQAGNIHFVDSEARPSVRRFFESGMSTPPSSTACCCPPSRTRSATTWP